MNSKTVDLSAFTLAHEHVENMRTLPWTAASSIWGFWTLLKGIEHCSRLWEPAGVCWDHLVLSVSPEKVQLGLRARRSLLPVGFVSGSHAELVESESLHFNFRSSITKWS